MLLIAVIVLALAGVIRPSWRAYSIVLVFVASVQAAVLAYSVGLFDSGADYASPEAASAYRDLAKVVILNTLVVATVGAFVVMLAKHFRERDRRELELLATLTKPRNDA